MTVGSRLGFLMIFLIFLDGEFKWFDLKPYYFLYLFIIFNLLLLDYWLSHHGINGFILQKHIKKHDFQKIGQLSKEETIALIDWYAFWLANFTGSFIRLNRLTSFQIAGGFNDLLSFERVALGLPNSTLSVVKKLVKNWSFADEQVFKVYYVVKIKKRAYFFLWTLFWQRKIDHRMNARYTDYLLDVYNKNYLEFSIWLLNRLIDGEDIYHVYQSYNFVQFSAKQKVSKKNYYKNLLKGSFYSLKN